jgi:hypothetical protein
LEFGYFTAFSLPASFLATILAKTFFIFVTFRKLFSRKYEKENFLFNPIFNPHGAKTVKWGEEAQQGV